MSLKVTLTSQRCSCMVIRQSSARYRGASTTPRRHDTAPAGYRLMDLPLQGEGESSSGFSGGGSFSFGGGTLCPGTGYPLGPCHADLQGLPLYCPLLYIGGFIHHLCI